MRNKTLLKKAKKNFKKSGKGFDKYKGIDDNNIVNTLGYKSIKSYGRAWSTRKDDRIFSILKCSQCPAAFFDEVQT